MCFMDFKLRTPFVLAAKNFHDCAQWAQAYGLLESLIPLLQQPAGLASRVPRMSYSSGSQASNTVRNKETLSLICQQTLIDFTVLSEYM